MISQRIIMLLTTSQSICWEQQQESLQQELIHHGWLAPGFAFFLGLLLAFIHLTGLVFSQKRNCFWEAGRSGTSRRHVALSEQSHFMHLGYSCCQRINMNSAFAQHPFISREFFFWRRAANFTLISSSHPAPPRRSCTSYRISQPQMNYTSCPNIFAPLRASPLRTDAGTRPCVPVPGVSGAQT